MPPETNAVLFQVAEWVDRYPLSAWGICFIVLFGFLWWAGTRAAYELEVRDPLAASDPQHDRLMDDIRELRTINQHLRAEVSSLRRQMEETQSDEVAEEEAEETPEPPRPRRASRKKAEPRISGPTVWERLLQDEEEESPPCPTPPTTEPPPPPPKKPRRKKG